MPPKLKFQEGTYYRSFTIPFVAIYFTNVDRYKKALGVFAGEKVLCFHGPLLYEAKVNIKPVACMAVNQYRLLGEYVLLYICSV
jgi:hypothetical protein